MPSMSKSQMMAMRAAKSGRSKIPQSAGQEFSAEDETTDERALPQKAKKKSPLADAMRRSKGNCNCKGACNCNC